MVSCMNHRNLTKNLRYEIRENEIFIVYNENDYHLAPDSKLGPIIGLETIDSDTENFISTVTRSCLSTGTKENNSKEYFESDNESDYQNELIINHSEYSKLDDHMIIPDNMTKNQINTLLIHRKYGHPSPEKTRTIMKSLNLTYSDYHCNLCSKHKLVKRIKKISRRKQLES